MIIPHDDTINNNVLFAKYLHFIKCESENVACMCGSAILLAFLHAREVGVSSRNLVSRTFPQFFQSMLTPMCSIILLLHFGEKRILSSSFRA